MTNLQSIRDGDEPDVVVDGDGNEVEVEPAIDKPDRACLNSLFYLQSKAVR